MDSAIHRLNNWGLESTYIFDIKLVNRPFYSSLLSCLAFEWKWGWRWTCCDRNLPAFLMLMKLFSCENLHKKNNEVSIKTRSLPASFSFKGHATKYTTVKWSIHTPEPWDRKLNFSNGPTLLVLLNSFITQCSSFLPVLHAKEFFKLVEDLWASLLIVSAQCTTWNRYMPHFSPITTGSFVLNSLWIQRSFGKTQLIFFGWQLHFHNSRPF